MIIPFPNVFKGKDANKHLREQLTTTEELSGLLNGALIGLRRLHENQEFSEPGSVKEELKNYRKANDPVTAFVDECCLTGINHEIERGELFDGFSKFCDENGYKELSKIKFYQKTRCLTNVNEKTIMGKRLFNGIDLSV